MISASSSVSPITPDIDGEMKSKLTELIKTQMDNLLTRIDETEEIDEP